jgi:hypothetical protein
LVDTGQANKKKDTRKVHKIIVEFELGVMTAANDVEFAHALELDSHFESLPETQQRRETHSHFTEFRHALHEVSGVYIRESGQELIYKQRLSQAAQERAIIKDMEVEAELHDPWTLQWDSEICKHGTRDKSTPPQTQTDKHRPRISGGTKQISGCWILKNKVLRGELWGYDQNHSKPPLGRHCRWTWTREQITSGSAHFRRDWKPPQGAVTLSCVELLENLKDHGSFGEVEMMRLGGGATDRTRETTARAVTDCHLSTLSSESYCKIKKLFPEQMEQNERYFKKTANRKGTNRRRGYTMRRTKSEPLSDKNSLRSLTPATSSSYSPGLAPLLEADTDKSPQSEAIANLMQSLFLLIAAHSRPVQEELLETMASHAQSALELVKTEETTIVQVDQTRQGWTNKALGKYPTYVDDDGFTAAALEEVSNGSLLPARAGSPSRR